MILNHARLAATPDFSGDSRCPDCDARLVAKCGRLVAWHWAHSARSECSNWKEETEWHLAWKALFPQEWIEKRYGDCRADVLLPSGEVIEFQRSAISVETIRAREKQCRGRIAWVFHAGEVGDRLDLRQRDASLHTFRWKHPRKTSLAVSGRLYLDLGDGSLFNIAKVGRASPIGGYGYLLPATDWVGAIIADQRLRPGGQLRKFETPA